MSVSNLEVSRPGEGLEREVARIYGLLGAKTEQRLLVGHYEIDVRAVLQRGPFSFAFVVECKEYGAERAVTVGDMATFATKLAAAKEKGKADRGVFVTTSKFSQDARATADECEIQCLTLRELRNQLVDFHPYLQDVVKGFETTDLARWYVEQTVSEFEDYDALAATDRKRSLHSSALEYIDGILSDAREDRIALLGNFGTGKSAFCHAYRAKLAHKALSSSDARIPVLIDLREFRAGLDIQQAIANALQRLPGVDASAQVCRELQRMGRFVFLLDGLDEMATKVDRTVINESLREIDRLRTEGDNQYLLTCRTHFFQERISDEFLAEYNVLYITEWNKQQLRAYFRKRFGADGPEKCARILENPQIAELAKTPLLLDILLATDDLKSDLVNVFGLLSRYTEGWITKQTMRRGAVMSSPQRRRFALTLASHMYTKSLNELHFSELYEVAREFCGHRDASSVDHFDADARTCTFITRDSKGNYSFRPQTFFDFFSADSVAAGIENGSSRALEVRDLSPEIIALMVERGIGNDGVDNLQAWSKKFESERLSPNAVRVLNGLGKELSPDVKLHYGVSDADKKAFEESQMGDSQEQIERLLLEHRPFLLRRAKSYGFRSSTMDAEDLVNETLARFFSQVNGAPHRLRSYLNVRTYLEAMMRNALWDHMRRPRGSERIVSIDDRDIREEVERTVAQDADASGGAESAQSVAEVKRAMDSLPSGERAAMRHRLEGLTIPEIAKTMTRTEPAVRVLLASGIRRLRDKLSN